MLVSKCVLSAEDYKFFNQIAKETEYLWFNLVELGQTEEDFNSQEFPDTDIPYANMPCQNLLTSEGLREKLANFCLAKSFDHNTNAIAYHPLSFMRWHTNSNAEGFRHYYTYTEGKSIFRWKDFNSGKMFTEVDDQGWTYRTFMISSKKPLWHTIWTEKTRLSFGFISGTINGAY